MKGPELIIDEKAELGEGPLWDHEKGFLYWLDITGKTLFFYNPAKNKNTPHGLPGMPTAVVKRSSGGLVMAMENGFYFYDPGREDCPYGSLEFIADPESDKPDNRFNDGKCDPAGRFWAGTLNTKNVPGQAALYRLDPDLSVHRMLGGLSLANGLVWTKDKKTMYFVDTMAKSVYSFDYIDETGDLTGRRVAIDGTNEEGFFDGMAIDGEGMLWIAHWGGSAICRWDPKRGKKIGEFPLPCPNVSACAFGGEKLRTLYITTARWGLNEKSLNEHPLSGGLFKMETDVSGTVFESFRG